MRPVAVAAVSRRLAVLTLTSTLFAPPAPAAEPSAEAVLAAKRAFRAFDDRQLPLAEDLFSKTIAEWRRLDRDVAELTSLLVARAGVRTDSNNFAAAKADLDEAIALMAPTGEPAGGPLHVPNTSVDIGSGEDDSSAAAGRPLAIRAGQRGTRTCQQR